MATDIVSLLLGPAQVITQGLIGLIVGLGLYALEIWLVYEIITMVPPSVKNLVDTIDDEASMRPMRTLSTVSQRISAPWQNAYCTGKKSLGGCEDGRIRRKVVEAGGGGRTERLDEIKPC
jgi:hypothetical protein